MLNIKHIIPIFSLSLLNHLSAAIGWAEGGSLTQADFDAAYGGANSGISSATLNGGVATDSVVMSAISGGPGAGTLYTHSSGANFTGTFTSSFFDASTGTTSPLDLVWRANDSTFFRFAQIVPELNSSLNMDIGDKIIINNSLSHLWEGPLNSSDRDLSTVIQNINLSIPGGSSQSTIGFNQTVFGNNIDLTQTNVSGDLIIDLEHRSSFVLSDITPDSTDSFSADGGQGIFFREFKNDPDVTNAQISGYSFELEALNTASLQAGDQFFITLDGNLRPNAAIPEPSSTLLLAGAFLPLAFYRKRK